MTNYIPKNWRAVRGNTYLCREELQEIGARWDRETGLWYVAPEKLEDAERIVENARIKAWR